MTVSKPKDSVPSQTREDLREAMLSQMKAEGLPPQIFYGLAPLKEGPMVERRKIKMSIFGSYAEVKRRNACEHVWTADPVIWWGRCTADWFCALCEGRKTNTPSVT